MQVILLQRIAKLGQMGDVVNVRDGYARNFLLPQKKAMRATEDNRKYFESQRAQLEAENLAHKLPQRQKEHHHEEHMREAEMNEGIGDEAHQFRRGPGLPLDHEVHDLAEEREVPDRVQPPADRLRTAHVAAPAGPEHQLGAEDRQRKRRYRGRDRIEQGLHVVVV